MKTHRKPVRKKLLLFAVRNACRPIVWAFSRTPWESAGRIARVLGPLAYFSSRRYRRAAVANLRAAFPEMGEAEARSITRRVFCNFCRALVEFFIVRRFGPSDLERVMELQGKEHADEALRRGKGAMILTAHMGNWEVLARKLVAEGYPMNVIARDSDDPTMTGVINSARRQGGYTVFERDKSVRSAMRCLKDNQFLGILPDQNTIGSCVFVDFFGRPAATAAGAAMFALKTGAAILPSFNHWEPHTKRYSAVIYPPLETPLTGDTDRDVELITAAYTKIIEAEIRKYPDQWLWLHSRWKRTRVADEA
ncbi:MAG: lysophospholipid acyltransferase family protein [Armatimonadota bacterium]|nr:lysophospholipid acyltransferase family protein [Armatimonadota bacterium]